MGIFYNVKPFRLKDKPYLDILSESLNNPIRLLLGWHMVVDTTLPPSSLILSFWMGGAFLMTVKRFAEIRSVKKTLLKKYRASFEYYTENLLLLKSFFYSLMTTFFLGIFLVKYRIEYLITFPFLSLLFVYYLSIGLSKNSITQTPEKLYKNKFLNLIVLINILVFLIATIYDFQNIKILTKSKNFD
jgi:4-hydroxybenzoate polyprenyltransferase